MEPRTGIAMILGAALAWAACGGDGGGGTATDAAEVGHGHGAEEGGCEHMKEGPGQAVAAVAPGAPAAPSVSAHHLRFDVTLPAAGDGFQGDVSYEADEGTDFAIFLDSDVPLQVLDGSGAVVAIEATEKPLELCTEVAVMHVVPLGVGTYRFRLGPAKASKVSVVVEESGGHEH
ncbi:MAG: hypothetical protein FJ087_09490 [Deltaproteobacteria bacterium]|nr:hypothetical protein [Deltaproteobacteria bacterium]